MLKTRFSTRALGISAILLIVSGLWVNAQSEQSIVLPVQPLLAYSMDWLAPGGEASVIPDRILVYSLSCEKCIQELSYVASGLKVAPDRFMLTAFKAKDRAVSIPLIAYGMAEPDKKLRRSGILELLRIYTGNPDYYLENPGDWETAVAANWPTGTQSDQDTISWAFATNILDMQSRILALTDKLGAPNAIELDRPVVANSVDRKSDRFDALIHTLATAWARPPLVNFESVSAIGSKIRFVNPLNSMSEKQWVELKNWANDGAYWLWGGQLSGDILESIVDWEAAYLLLRDDAARLERLNQWLDKTIARAVGGPISPIDAFGMVDIDSLASPVWNVAQEDARQHLVFANYWGSLIGRDSK
ncbi:MAG: hypothetical protein HN457_18080 [Opitutales bacterium]|nr:hypothetical protein [Opitutales bacterium]